MESWFHTRCLTAIVFFYSTVVGQFIIKTNITGRKNTKPDDKFITFIKFIEVRRSMLQSVVPTNTSCKT